MTRPIKQPSNKDSAAFYELMSKYDEYRAKWIKQHGTHMGFDAWFNQQLSLKQKGT